jgi:hypothetical protein
MKKLIYLFIIAFVACKTEPPKIEKTSSACVPSNISYVKHIKPIITTNCATGSGCHGVGSPFGNFVNYDQLNAKCLDGTFNKEVFIEKGMPPAGMDSCDYLTLRRWYNNGHTPN